MSRKHSADRRTLASDPI
ncbi:hypothetical protein Golob_027726 [Gossypium lobatum]|uniref:Uncharacterized protein n=1 Tax=Gossypium lobatum TaxID=34289 RepID=A0A7J8NHS6_9ROSI|nr:hypothetical protein [Gossypium lobatum]